MRGGEGGLVGVQEGSPPSLSACTLPPGSHPLTRRDPRTGLQGGAAQVCWSGDGAQMEMVSPYSQDDVKPN